MAPINKTIASEYGKRFGGFLIRIGKENFDMNYNKKKAEGTDPYLPIVPVPKFFVRRDLVESIKFVDSPISNEKMIVFNDDIKLSIPCNTPLRKATPEAVIEAIKSANDPSALDGFFFDSEEVVVEIIENFNNQTIAKLDIAVTNYLETMEGLKKINKIARANMEAEKE